MLSHEILISKEKMDTLKQSQCRTCFTPSGDFVCFHDIAVSGTLSEMMTYGDLFAEVTHISVSGKES